MKAEFNIDTQEIVREITREVIRELKPYLTGKSEDDNLFSVESLAKYLQVETSWVYKKVSSKTIPFFKSGKYVRFKKTSIDRWITSQENLTTHIKRYVG